MFSEILKIKPQLDQRDLKTMEQQLSTRFTKLAKKFGKGLVGAFKGGGLLAAGLSAMNKFLNPLKEVQEAIDKTLMSADDLATYANQFGTSTGKLFKLVQLGKATGIDQSNMFLLLSKFQSAVATAKLNPNDPMASSVREYTSIDDTSDAFFEFIQALQKLDKGTQVLVQEQVFGARQILKTADFLQQDFGSLLKRTRLDRVNPDRASKIINRGADLNDQKDINSVIVDTDDFLKKNAQINNQMLAQIMEADALEKRRERNRIDSFEALAAVQETSNKLLEQIEKGVTAIGEFIPAVTKKIDNVIERIDKFKSSDFIRNIFRFGKGGK